MAVVNDFFNNLVALVRRTTVRAEAVNSILGAIKSGFDLLPSKARMYEERVAYSVDSGVANAYVITPTYAVTLTDGASVTFKAGNTNTGASTANVYALGVIAICDYSGAALAAGAIVVNAFITMRYSTTSAHWRIQNPNVTVTSVNALDIPGLTALTAPDDADLAPTYDTSATAVRKVTLQNYLIVGWATAAAVDPAADYTLIYDTSAGALKKALTNTLSDEGNNILLAQVMQL